MNEEESAVIDSMSDEDIAARLKGLSRYQRYDTVASCYDAGPMTPRQVKAWAAFAETLDGDITMGDGAIYREKEFGQLAEVIARNEIEKRRLAAEREAELATAVDFRAANAHP